jgi:hypothetical protein
MLSLPIDPPKAGELDFTQPSISNARISALSLAHDDLDCAIKALVAANGHDELIVARLKKRKLQLRDEIAGIRARMPDAPAETALSNEEDIPADGTAPPKSGGGSLVFGVVGVLVLMVLGLVWSDAADAAQQTVARIYLLSLLAAANG